MYLVSIILVNLFAVNLTNPPNVVVTFDIISMAFLTKYIICQDYLRYATIRCVEDSELIRASLRKVQFLFLEKWHYLSIADVLSHCFLGEQQCRRRGRVVRA